LDKNLDENLTQILTKNNFLIWPKRCFVIFRSGRCPKNLQNRIYRIGQWQHNDQEFEKDFYARFGGNFPRRTFYSQSRATNAKNAKSNFISTNGESKVIKMAKSTITGKCNYSSYPLIVSFNCNKKTKELFNLLIWQKSQSATISLIVN